MGLSLLLFAQTAHPLTQVVLTRYSELRWRINRILDETNPFLADIDGGRLAIERSYNDQDPDLALRAFDVARTKNLEKLRGVDTEGLEREGTLEGVGLVTLKRLSEMMREHDEGHVEELRVLRQKLKRLCQA